MAQIAGNLQNIEIDVTGAGSAYKTLVCLRTSSVNTTASVSEEETNCGKLTSVGTPGFSFDFDAICESAPGGSSISYKDCLTCINAGTKVKVRFRNPTITGSSVGTVYYHESEAYFTDLTLNQDASGGAYINFSGTLQSTGTLVIVQP
jgi:hypothetical protein